MSLWTEAKYPGDAVRVQLLYRGGHGRPVELGEVCIQKYDNVVRVGSFLPGVDVTLPGDTPKTIPEKYMHYRYDHPADAQFEAYVQEAYDAGWQNYHPEQHGTLANG